MQISHLPKTEATYTIAANGVAERFTSANPYKHAWSQRKKLADNRHPNKVLQAAFNTDPTSIIVEAPEQTQEPVSETAVVLPPPDLPDAPETPEWVASLTVMEQRAWKYRHASVENYERERDAANARKRARAAGMATEDPEQFARLVAEEKRLVALKVFRWQANEIWKKHCSAV